jgi:hypothetical protein
MTKKNKTKTQHNTICVSYVKDGINSYFHSSLIDVVRQLIRKCQLRSIDFHSFQLICICYNKKKWFDYNSQVFADIK